MLTLFSVVVAVKVIVAHFASVVDVVSVFVAVAHIVEFVVAFAVVDLPADVACIVFGILVLAIVIAVVTAVAVGIAVRYGGSRQCCYCGGRLCRCRCCC